MSKRLTYGGKPTKHALHIEACKEALDWQWLTEKAEALAIAYGTLSQGSVRDSEKHMGELFRLIEELWGTVLDIDIAALCKTTNGLNDARQTTRQSDKEVI